MVLCALLYCLQALTFPGRLLSGDTKESDTAFHARRNCVVALSSKGWLSSEQCQHYLDACELAAQQGASCVTGCGACCRDGVVTVVVATPLGACVTDSVTCTAKRELARQQALNAGTPQILAGVRLLPRLATSCVVTQSASRPSMKAATPSTAAAAARIQSEACQAFADHVRVLWMQTAALAARCQAQGGDDVTRVGVLLVEAVSRCLARHINAGATQRMVVRWMWPTLLWIRGVPEVHDTVWQRLSELTSTHLTKLSSHHIAAVAILAVGLCTRRCSAPNSGGATAGVVTNLHPNPSDGGSELRPGQTGDRASGGSSSNQDQHQVGRAQAHNPTPGCHVADTDRFARLLLGAVQSASTAARLQAVAVLCSETVAAIGCYAPLECLLCTPLEVGERVGIGHGDTQDMGRGRGKGKGKGNDVEKSQVSDLDDSPASFVSLLPITFLRTAQWVVHRLNTVAAACSSNRDLASQLGKDARTLSKQCNAVLSRWPHALQTTSNGGTMFHFRTILDLEMSCFLPVPSVGVPSSQTPITLSASATQPDKLDRSPRLSTTSFAFLRDVSPVLASRLGPMGWCTEAVLAVATAWADVEGAMGGDAHVWALVLSDSVQALRFRACVHAVMGPPSPRSVQSLCGAVSHLLLAEMSAPCEADDRRPPCAMLVAVACAYGMVACPAMLPTLSAAVGHMLNAAAVAVPSWPAGITKVLVRGWLDPRTSVRRTGRISSSSTPSLPGELPQSLAMRLESLTWFVLRVADHAQALWSGLFRHCTPLPHKGATETGIVVGDEGGVGVGARVGVSDEVDGEATSFARVLCTLHTAVQQTTAGRGRSSIAQLSPTPSPSLLHALAPLPQATASLVARHLWRNTARNTHHTFFKRGPAARCEQRLLMRLWDKLTPTGTLASMAPRLHAALGSQADSTAHLSGLLHVCRTALITLLRRGATSSQEDTVPVVGTAWACLEAMPPDGLLPVWGCADQASCLAFLQVLGMLSPSVSMPILVKHKGWLEVLCLAFLGSSDAGGASRGFIVMPSAISQIKRLMHDTLAFFASMETSATPDIDSELVARVTGEDPIIGAQLAAAISDDL